jgi:methyl-accepting chemotaxis protein
MVKDGRSVFIKPSANVLLDSKGNKVGYVEVARIVTDLVEAERAVHDKLDQIRSVHEATREAASHLMQAASEMEGQFGDMQKALDKQQGRLRDSATSMTQMHTTVQQVAKSASEAAAQSQAARENAGRGANIVEDSIQAILRVHEHAASLKLSMHELDKQAQAVEAVLGVISDIADQTNLLALNAAIEAARAGESGRGFAVVADEVRKLAEKTVQTTAEVDKAIVAIQRGAQDAGRLVDETGDLAEHASGLASLSGEALHSIVELVNASSGQMGHIAAAAEQQSATSAHINSILDEVAGMTSEVSGRMAASAEAVHSLSVLADQLDSFAALS